MKCKRQNQTKHTHKISVRCMHVLFFSSLLSCSFFLFVFFIVILIHNLTANINGLAKNNLTHVFDMYLYIECIDIYIFICIIRSYTAWHRLYPMALLASLFNTKCCLDIEISCVNGQTVIVIVMLCYLCRAIALCFDTLSSSNTLLESFRKSAYVQNLNSPNSYRSKINGQWTKQNTEKKDDRATRKN